MLRSQVQGGRTAPYPPPLRVPNHCFQMVNPLAIPIGSERSANADNTIPSPLTRDISLHLQSVIPAQRHGSQEGRRFDEWEERWEPA